MRGKTLVLPAFISTPLFLATLVAKDMAQEMAFSLPGLLLLFEVVGLTKASLFLKMDCCQTLRAATTFP